MAKMDRIVFEESWIGSGTIAVKLQDGSYRVYIDPEVFQNRYTGQSIAEFPAVANAVVEAKLGILQGKAK